MYANLFQRNKLIKILNNSLGTIIHICGLRNKILSLPQKTLLTFGNSNCENCCRL